jgi:hypothetical protein
VDFFLSNWPKRSDLISCKKLNARDKLAVKSKYQFNLKMMLVALMNVIFTYVISSSLL